MSESDSAIRCWICSSLLFFKSIERWMTRRWVMHDFVCSYAILFEYDERTKQRKMNEKNVVRMNWTCEFVSRWVCLLIDTENKSTKMGNNWKLEVDMRNECSKAINLNSMCLNASKYRKYERSQTLKRMSEDRGTPKSNVKSGMKWNRCELQWKSECDGNFFTLLIYYILEIIW